MRDPSGRWRWYRQRGVALRDANGRAWRMAGSVEDILKIEENIRALEEEIESSEGRLRYFARIRVWSG